MILPTRFPFAVIPGLARDHADSAALSGPAWPARIAEARSRDAGHWGADGALSTGVSRASMAQRGVRARTYANGSANFSPLLAYSRDLQRKTGGTLPTCAISGVADDFKIPGVPACIGLKIAWQSLDSIRLVVATAKSKEQREAGR